MDQRKKEIYRAIDRHMRSTKKSKFNIKNSFYAATDKLKNKATGLRIQKSTQIKRLGPEVEIENMEPKQKQVEEAVEEEFKEVEKEEKTARRSFFAKIGDLFKKNEEKEEALPMEEPAKKAEITGTEEDLKEALKIYLNLVQRLSPPMFERYKETDDFKRFKELLKKYDVKKL